MGNIRYIEEEYYNREAIKGLYNDSKWYAYTNDMDRLIYALQSSLKVIVAWDNDKLIGLIRVVGDGHTIIYIQDILVMNNYRRKGIGTELINKILKEYQSVRQKILLTDDTYITNRFYTSLGFRNSKDCNLSCFVKFN